MARAPENHGNPWSDADKEALRKLADGNTPTRVMGIKLGRTEDAIRAEAQRIDVSLKPVNQSPRTPKKN